MATRRIEVIIGGDASAAQKAFRDVEQAAGSSQPKVEGFGKEFLKLGAAFGLGTSAADIAVETLRGLAEMVGEYNKKMQDSEATILGVTKSQGALNSAFAFAESELKAGRAAYSDTVAAIAELTPTAKRAGLDVQELFRTVQLLSALNSGPDGGVAGAVVAINNALAGQFTSLQDRFNISTQGIQKAIQAGVPPLQAINAALAKEGVTMDLVNARAKTFANQQAIAKDQVARLAAEVGKPIFDALADGLEKTNKQLTSAEWAHYAEQYQQFVKMLVESLTSWKALSGVAEEVGIQIERTLQGWVVGFLTASESIAQAIGKMLHIPDQYLAGAKDNNPLQKVFDAWVAHTDADQAKLDAWFKENFADPVSNAAQGNTPGSSAIAPAAMQGYGQTVIEGYLKGLSSANVDEVQKIVGQFGALFKDSAGKDDPAKLSNAYVVLSRALAELASKGQLTDDAMRDLSATFGLQTPDVYKLLAAYNQYQQALSGVALAQVKVQGATAATAVVTAQAAGETKQLQDNLDAATKAAQADADASAAVAEGLQGTLKGVQDTAEEAARAGQAQLAGLQEGLDGLQDAASQHAAARQAETAAAQAQLSAASQQRSNDQALLNAAIAGELEYEEQILDGLTDQQRAIAAKWQAEIDGQRRAKEGADQKVTDLTRAAHKEDRDALHEINDLRSSGHEKEARAAERALAARQKQRAAAMTLAQADAAVANDEFDAAQEKVKKEGQDQEVKDTQAEKGAQANLTRIQSAADAQKAADDAAIAAKNDQIKKVQDAQKAEQERYADQERGIQREIDKTTEAATIQAAKDKKTIDDATTILNDRKTYWDQELLKAGQAVTQAQNQETSAKNYADHMKDAFDYAEKISKLDFSNVTNAANALAQVQPPSGAAGAQGGGRDSHSGAPQASGAPPPTPADQARAAAAGLPPLIDGQRYPYPPEGYHAEYDQAGYRWYVPDGHTLTEYNQLGGTGSNKAPLSPVRAGSPLAGVGPIGGPGLQFQRARLGGSPGDSEGAGGTTIIINAPNLRDVRDKRDLDDLGAHLERTWKDIARGGRTKREVG